MRKFGEGFFGSVDQLMHDTGFNKWAVAAPVVNTGHSAMQGGFDSMHGYWDGDTGTQALAQAAGDVTSNIGAAGMAGYWAWDTARKVGSIEGYKMPWGTVFGQSRSGSMRNMRTGANIFDSSQIASIKNTGRAGYFKGSAAGQTGKFMKTPAIWNEHKFFGASASKGLGWKRFMPSMRSLAGMAGITLAAEAGVRVVGGAVGKVLDSAISDYRDKRRLTYDHRMFDSRAADQGSMWKMSSANQEYQARMYNVARIYHAR